MDAQGAAGYKKPCRTDPQIIVVVFTGDHKAVCLLGLLVRYGFPKIRDPDALTVFFPVVELQDPSAGFPDCLRNITVGIQCLIVAEHTDQSGVNGQRTHGAEHGLLEFLLRCQAGLLHDGIHPASHKIDVRKAFLQCLKDKSGISAHKVMQADQENSHSAGAIRKAADDV